MSAAPVGRVVGTAGHIDHGKTSLVRALTGIDTDRLKEEKARGITIELGFAHLTLPSGTSVGVVDVPGHERFVRTMVAGAVGIDLVVLVVAADEGVMPQTREHLDICGLLGIRRGVVALSKADTVDPELLALATADVAEALVGTCLEGAPVVPCSAKTGAGLPALLAAIDEGLRDAPAKDPDGLARLPIDRVFSMKGFGTVVTGTLWAGRLRVGDDVVALPPPGPAGTPAPAKVRTLQVHGAAVEVAVAGQRTAANLTLPREALERGEVLVRAGELEAGRLLDVRISYLGTCRAPLKRRARVLFHAGTAQTLATVSLLDHGVLEPGEGGLAQLQLDRPMVLLPGDAFIIRGFQLQRHHGTTLGGGTVLRTLGARHRRGTPELLASLRACETAAPDDRVFLEIARAGTAGLGRRELQMRLPCSPKVTETALGKLLAGRRVVRFDKERGALIAAGALDALRETALLAVAAAHAADPLAEGMPREELRARVTEDVRLLHVVLEGLVQEGKLKLDRERVRLPGHDPKKSQAAVGLSPLIERLARLYAEAALQPPRPAEVVAALGADPEELDRALALLVRGGTLVKVRDLWFDRAALDGLRARLVAFLESKGQITAQEWKDLVGATRKFAIPLAEHFDAEKVTLRIGEVRKLRGAPPRSG